MLTPFLTLAEADPLGHVVNHPWFVNDQGYWIWSGNQGNLVLSAIILIFGMMWVGKKVSTGPASEGNDAFVTKNRFAHMIEVICVYLREEVARPMLGDRTDRLMPFLWSLFFFILVNNLLGLFPILDVLNLIFPQWAKSHSAFIGGTATQNLWVTGVMAVIAGIVFNLEAVKRLGVGGYLSHMTAGAPWFVAWMIFPIELAGQFLIKPGALAIRLFANMTAGHILLAVLMSFVAAVWGKNILLSGPVTIISLGGAVGSFIAAVIGAIVLILIFRLIRRAGG